MPTLLITSFMDMPGLCSLSSAFRVGGAGFLGQVFNLFSVDNMVALLQGFQDYCQVFFGGVLRDCVEVVFS